MILTQIMREALGGGRQRMHLQMWSGNTWAMFTLRTATIGIIELRWLLRRKGGSIKDGWKCFTLTLSSSII